MPMQHCNKYQNNQNMSLPSGSDILPIYWSCRASVIYDLPIYPQKSCSTSLDPTFKASSPWGPIRGAKKPFHLDLLSGWETLQVDGDCQMFSPAELSLAKSREAWKYRIIFSTANTELSFHQQTHRIIFSTANIIRKTALINRLVESFSHQKT